MIRYGTPPSQRETNLRRRLSGSHPTERGPRWVGHRDKDVEKLRTGHAGSVVQDHLENYTHHESLGTFGREFERNGAG
jgi:hypothetical protein